MILYTYGKKVMKSGLLIRLTGSIILSFFLFLFLFLVSSPPVAADPLEPIGPAHIAQGAWEIIPLACFEETYSTNVFRRSQYYTAGTADQQEDLITTLGLGLKASLGDERFKFTTHQLGYDYIYMTNTNLNNYKYDGKGVLKLKTGIGVFLELSENFIYIDAPPLAEYLISRSYYTNTAGAIIGYGVPQYYVVQALYKNSLRRYGEEDFLAGDFQEHAGGLQIEYYVSNTTILKAIYLHEIRTFDHVANDDYVRQTGQTGFNFKIVGGLSGYFLAGYTQKSYQDTVAGRPASYNTWSLDANLVERFTDYTTASLRMIRGIETEETSLTEYSSSATFYKTATIARLKHFFDYAYYGAGELSFSQLDYRDPVFFYGAGNEAFYQKRQDNQWSGALEAGYDNKKWMRAALRYRYTSNDSNVDFLTYQESQLSLSLNLSY